MKKLIAAVVGIAIACGGCLYGGYAWGMKDATYTATAALPKQSPPNDQKQAPSERQPQITMKVKTENETIAGSKNSMAEGFTAIDTQNVVLNGTKMQVILYTSAMKGTDGKLELDAGQSWVVEAKDETGVCYTLYNQYVNHGQIYFSVGQEDGKDAVMIYEITSSGSRIMRCEFSGKEFQKYVEYSKDNMNVQYSSFPDYQ